MIYLFLKNKYLNKKFEQNTLNISISFIIIKYVTSIKLWKESFLTCIKYPLTSLRIR